MKLTEIVTKSETWVAASDRFSRLANDNTAEREFWGEGWSHFPEAFECEIDGLCVRICCHNYARLKFAWCPRDPATANRAWPDGADWAYGELTLEETITLGSEIGMEITDWLDRANQACDTDVFSDRDAETPMAEIRRQTEVDPATFHALRSGD